MERGAPMTSDRVGYDAVADALWRQREALELVAGALAGHGSLAHAIDDLRLGEVLRCAAAEDACRSLGLPSDTGLAGLASTAAEPWQTILLMHLVELRRLYTEVTALAAMTGRRIWQESLDDFLR
jgi:hypothetical protein